MEHDNDNTEDNLQTEIVETAVPEAVDVPEKSLREQIVEASEQAKSPRERDETGKFKEKLALDKVDTVAPVAKEIAAPASWKGEIKAKHWAGLPQEVKEEISRREDEAHKGFTRLDEDRQLGKQIKDVMNPYMPQMRMEGANPVEVVQSLLNVSHIMRNGDPVRKAQEVHNIIRQFGVDMSLIGQQGQQPQSNPQVAMLQHEIQQLKGLMAQQEDGKVHAVIEDFAADPANTHFEQVRPMMSKLLSGGLATTLQEAYEQAVQLDPSIRQQVSAQATQEAAVKKQQELEAKKRAAVSVNGSSSIPLQTPTNPNRTLREELQANMEKFARV